MKNFKVYKIFSFFILFLFLGPLITLGAEWQEPTCDPPDCNVTAPLNQGDTPQFKTGGLHVGESPLGGYQFSVQNGPSYFGDLEVGGNATITASNGSFETKGNIVLQGNNLIINDPGSLHMSRTGSQINLNGLVPDEGLSIAILTGLAGTAVKVRDDNSDPDSVAIGAGIINGTAIYGSSGGGQGVHGTGSGNGAIGVFGEATNSSAIAGRFDGEVRFNPYSGADYTSIDGNQAVFEEGGRKVEISPDDYPYGIRMDGDLAMILGDIDVIAGLIDMHNDKIIRLEDPTDETDAANKRYVDAAIAGGDNDWILSGNNIYREDGNVSIGTDSADNYKLTVDYGSASPGSPDTGVLKVTAGLGDVYSLYNIDGTKNYGLYVDMYSSANNYAASFMNGNVGIGNNQPEYALDVMGQIGIGCNNGTSDNPSNAIRIGDAGFIYDSSCGGTCPGGHCHSKTFHIDAEEDIIIQSTNTVSILGGGFGTSSGNYGIYVNDMGYVGMGTNNDPYFNLTVEEDANPAYIGILNGNTAIINGTSLGSLMFSGTDSHGSSPATGAAIEVEAMGTWGSDRSDSPARLKFYTQISGSANGFEYPAMTIESDNDAIISGDLSLGKETNSDTSILERTPLGQNGVGADLIIRASDASCASCTAGGGGFAGGDLYIYGGNDWDLGGDGDVILGYTEAGIARGKVGIGTDSPSTDLEVDGDTTIQGDLIVVTDAFQIGSNLDVTGAIGAGDDIHTDSNLEVGDTLKTNNIEPYCSGGSCPVGGSDTIEFDTSSGNLIITLPSGGVGHVE